MTQNLIGTYPYMAPQMFSVGRRSEAIDIYSLGCVYVTGFGKMCIVHTSNFSHSKIHKIQKKQCTVKFAGVIEEW